MKSAHVVLFDLGGVLVGNPGREKLTAMLPHPLEPDEVLARWLASPSVKRFESGATTPEAFAAAFLDEWGLRMSPAEFLGSFAGWVTQLFPGAAELLQRLRTRHRVACLSNTNTVHWARLSHLQGCFDHCFLSHEMGVMKPAAAAFEYALARLGAPPASVHFFDDLLPNVQAARALGIRAHHVRAFADIEPILRAEGLLAPG